MASLFIKSGNAARSTAPDRYEKLLAVGAVALLLLVVVALGKGLQHWPVPAFVGTRLVRHSATSRFGVIHLLSVVVIVFEPRVWLTATRHQLAVHRATVRGLVTGAPIVAGYFTLLETCLLGHWLVA